MVNVGCPVPRGVTWHNPRDSHAGVAVAFLAQEPPSSARPATQRRRHAGHNPIMAPLLIFGAVVLLAALYVAYILWPRWPQGLVSLNAPSLPIVVSGVTFNVEPAAIRIGVQRRPGMQQRVDLSYLWPSLVPPDPAVKPTVGAPLDPNERLFVTHFIRRRNAATIGSRSDDLPALSCAATGRRLSWIDLPRISRRLALSRRGPGV